MPSRTYRLRRASPVWAGLARPDLPFTSPGSLAPGLARARDASPDRGRESRGRGPGAAVLGLARGVRSKDPAMGLARFAGGGSVGSMGDCDL